MIIIDKLILEENLDYILITDVILSATLEGTDSQQKIQIYLTVVFVSFSLGTNNAYNNVDYYYCM